MGFYKNIIGGFIVSVSTQHGNVHITEAEYNELRGIIRTAPLAPDGYAYMLRADTLEWDLVELPPAPEPVEEDATAEDYEAALSELGVTV